MRVYWCVCAYVSFFFFQFSHLLFNSTLKVGCNSLRLSISYPNPGPCIHRWQRCNYVVSCSLCAFIVINTLVSLYVCSGNYFNISRGTKLKGGGTLHEVALAKGKAEGSTCVLDMACMPHTVLCNTPIITQDQQKIHH